MYNHNQQFFRHLAFSSAEMTETENDNEEDSRRVKVECSMT